MYTQPAEKARENFNALKRELLPPEPIGALMESEAEEKIYPKSQGARAFLKHAWITVAVDLAYLAVNLTAVLDVYKRQTLGCVRGGRAPARAARMRA